MLTPEFDKTTTGTEVAEVFKDQIRGKHVLITGASPNSLGEAAALAMARAGPALLILASRTRSRLEAVASRITAVAAPGVIVEVRVVVLDLASQESVRRAAREIVCLTDRLDVVINNAGIHVKDRQVSSEGIELTFATNHVGPFVLTSLLLPLLQAAARVREPGQTRVVNVSSDGHRICPMRFGDFNFEGKPVPGEELPRRGLPDWVTTLVGGYSGMLAYGMSKCANVLFTVALQERLRSQGIECYAANPGSKDPVKLFEVVDSLRFALAIRTGLVRDIQAEFREQLKAAPAEAWKTTDQGCATILAAAWDPSLSGSNCIYLSDCRSVRPSAHASDKAKAERLWTLSEILVNSKPKNSHL